MHLLKGEIKQGLRTFKKRLNFHGFFPDLIRHLGLEKFRESHGIAGQI